VKFLKAIFGLALLILFIGSFFALPRLLKIKEITCQSQFGPCNVEIQKTIDKVKNGGKSLYDTKKELQTLLVSEILISDFSFQFKLPNILVINVIERKPKYAIRTKNSNSYALVDKEGYVVYFQEQTGLPILIVSEPPPNVGQKVSEKTFFALEILYSMFSSYQIREGIIEDESLVIELNQGPKVIFPLEGERDVLLGSLTLVLSRLNAGDEETKIENVSGASIIDLRFKNPVIK
jgi:cell division septal protein FtsQ